MISQGSLRPQSEDIAIADEHMVSFLQALKQDKLLISKNLIKSIYWALTLPQNPLRLSKENNAALVKIAEAYTTGSTQANGASATNADDKTLSNTAREVVRICKSQTY